MTENYVDLTDYPRDVIVEMADKVIEDAGGNADIYFKATCSFCGERCMFQEPNKLYQNMECRKCGRTFPVHKAGYAVHFYLRGRPQ